MRRRVLQVNDDSASEGTSPKKGNRQHNLLHLLVELYLSGKSVLYFSAIKRMFYALALNPISLYYEAILA